MAAAKSSSSPPAALYVSPSHTAEVLLLLLMLQLLFGHGFFFFLVFLACFICRSDPSTTYYCDALVRPLCGLLVGQTLKCCLISCSYKALVESVTTSSSFLKYLNSKSDTVCKSTLVILQPIDDSLLSGSWKDCKLQKKFA